MSSILGLDTLRQAAGDIEEANFTCGTHLFMICYVVSQTAVSTRRRAVGDRQHATQAYAFWAMASPYPQVFAIVPGAQYHNFQRRKVV